MHKTNCQLAGRAARLAYLRRRRRFEIGLGALLLGLVAALLACQCWLYRERQPLDAWYGSDYAEAAPVVQQSEGLWGNVTLELVDYSELIRAVVLLNGQEAGRFVDNSLTLRVFAGDLLEIDCTAYSRPVRFALTKASTGIDRERLQTDLELCGEKGVVGRITFK